MLCCAAGMALGLQRSLPPLPLPLPGKPGLDVGGTAWNATTVPLIRAARAHCVVVLHANMLQAIDALAVEEKVGLGDVCVMVGGSH